MTMSDPKHEAEALALHKQFQEVLGARTRLKEALEDEAEAQRAYIAAKSVAERRTLEVNDKTKELAEALGTMPTPRTLEVICAEVNAASEQLRKDQEGASHVGSSNQGQVAAERPD